MRLRSVVWSCGLLVLWACALPALAQTPAPCPPQAIYDVLAGVTWTAAAPPPEVTLSGYVLSRQTNDGPLQPLTPKPLPPDTLRYVDGLETPLAAGSTYRYHLVAVMTLPSGHTRLSTPWTDAPAHCPALTVVPLTPPGQLSAEGIVLSEAERATLTPATKTPARKGAPR